MTRFPRWAALPLALASTLPLAFSATAGATVAPPVVDGKLLTVAGDGDPDTITLTVTGGLIAVNGAATTLQADEEAEIEVEGGAGDDLIDASALAATNYEVLTVLAGPGDDTVTGGADGDAISGDAGNDRLIGFRATDDIVGGDGDDVMIWNNGDGSDENTGGPGFDETEINGSPTAGDDFVFAANPGVPGGVRFDRTNLITFNIELTAERLTMNGLGGEDTQMPNPAAAGNAAGLTSLTLNGGAGNDTLVGEEASGDLLIGGDGDDELLGGGGADLIAAGAGADELAGGSGDDRLVGDRGGDRASGATGDDTAVWNNGDGSDVNEGGPGFDRVEVNGSTSAGDSFELIPELGGATFKRTNLVPFTIRLSDEDDNPGIEANGGFEAIAVNGGGGNDSFVVAPGLRALQASADGGAGDDTLAGGEEADSFFGGSGQDTIDAGSGGDVVDGQDGNDRLFARDGIGDLVRGGAGLDNASTDAVTLDAVDGVEALDATPAPVADAVAQPPKVGRVTVVGSGGKLFARVRLDCPAAEQGGCRTALTIETARATRLGGVRAVLVLGTASAKLRGGQSAAVKVRLLRGLPALSKRGSLAARLRLTSTDAAGNSSSRSTRLNLRVPTP